MDSIWNTRFEQATQTLRGVGQSHVLRHWESLSDQERQQLLCDLEAINWPLVSPLIESHVCKRPDARERHTYAPAPAFPAHPKPEQQPTYDKAKTTGLHWLHAGKVAALTVAGGQGTRLGFEGPKGAFPVTPIRNASLFQWFAEMIQAARAKYGVAMPWYIMTSPVNHNATRTLFERNDYFGLSPSEVVMFLQGQMPAFDPDGRLLLAEKHRLALSPDGHGGTLKALVAGGALADMRNRGVKTISYFQVDNPLVKPFDPLFIGLHVENGSEMSTKVARKSSDFERVGNVCLQDGRLTVVEYSEFADDLATATNPDSSRKFDAGNLAIHLLDVDFVHRVIDVAFRLPFRRAEKAVPFINDDGALVQPSQPNAVKLEMFVFDALPLAKNPLVLEVDRAEEFSPVKNASGADSLDSATRDQVARAYAWLERAGLHPPRRQDGTAAATVEIAPSFALDAEDVARRRGEVAEILPGAETVLE